MSSEFEGPTPTEKFDHSVLENYSEGDAEFENDLIKSYMTSVMEHLPKLEDSLKDKDSKNSILHSHDIKGSSSYIGAEVVRFISGKIEAYCKEEKLEEAEKFYIDLKSEVDKVFKILNDYLASLGIKGEDSTAAQEETNNSNSNPTSPPQSSEQTTTFTPTNETVTSIADAQQVELLEKKEAQQSKDDLIKHNSNSNNKTATEESPLSNTSSTSTTTKETPKSESSSSSSASSSTPSSKTPSSSSTTS
ncbi:hypothetical protein CYY_004124 [Polysphondylium violaceum]|uniref:HPt domain-containing protein n=1 Tax=Polysphondylium violaceum TaxID=133409 RepID=A0A8J4V0L9_9MYCE|nr:hypothetical protein CYY_004124 [Polysphondylium violaceum]